jgi:hypothetical protein
MTAPVDLGRDHSPLGPSWYRDDEVRPSVCYLVLDSICIYSHNLLP